MFVGRSITVIRAHYSSPSTNHCRQQHLMPLTSSTQRRGSLPHYTYLAGSLTEWKPQQNDWPTDSLADQCVSLRLSNSLSALFTPCLPNCFLSTYLLERVNERQHWGGGKQWMAREGGWRMDKEWWGIAREAKHCQSENHLKLWRSVMLSTCLFWSPFKM